MPVDRDLDCTNVKPAMSASRQFTPQNQKLSPTKLSLKRSSSDESHPTDKRLKRLTDDVLPKSPYLLTVPTENPFRLGSQHVNNWGTGSAFSASEEHLQYMTFYSRQTEDSLLVALGGWSDDDGNIMEEDISKPDSVISGASTPLNGPQRKKITFSDYKNKAKGSQVQVEAEGGVMKKEETQAGAKAELKINGESTESKETPKMEPLASNSVVGRKRPHEETADPPSAKPPTPSDPPRPEKKPRLSPSPGKPVIKDAPNVSTKYETKRQPNVNGVPRLLSPTLPPAAITPKLPPLLSPTLPPGLEDDLIKYLGSQPSNGKVVHKRTDSVKSTVSKADSVQSTTSEDKKESMAPSTRTEAKTTLSGKSTNARATSTTSKTALEMSRSNSGLSTKVGSETKVLNLSKPSENRPLPSTPGKFQKPATSASGPIKLTGDTITKTKLIVKLKYGKKYRKNVEGLLKFPPKPRKLKSNLPSMPDVQSDLSQSRKDSNKSQSGNKELEHARNQVVASRVEKRPRTAEDDQSREQSTKRQKVPSSSKLLDKATTPNPSDLQSPSLHQQPTAARSQFSSPMKEMKGAAMRRVESGDGDVGTPRGAIRMGTPTAPSSAEKGLAATKASPPSSSGHFGLKSRDDERRAWRNEHVKYANLGRELKHEADRLKETDGKLSVATAIEAILCFMIAFVASDQMAVGTRQAGDSENWRTILAYQNAVKIGSEPYPYVQGLCVQLGAVSRDVIHSLDLERLLNSPLPCDGSPAPTPGSDGNSATSEEAKKAADYKKSFLDLKARLYDIPKEALHLWLKGGRKLPDEILALKFPNTWSNRSRSQATRGEEKLVPALYAGEFFLPLGRATTAIEAIRFAWSFLGEWCSKEDVKWKGKISGL